MTCAYKVHRVKNGTGATTTAKFEVSMWGFFLIQE